MLKKPYSYKDTVAALQKEFEATIAQADKEIPFLEESIKIIPQEFSFHAQIQDHINCLVDARIRARHYLGIITGNTESEAPVVGWTPPGNRITMEPPSPEEPSSGGGFQ
jgi:hypothetical protein